MQRFYENSKLTSRAGKRAWRLRIKSPRKLRIELDASLGAMRRGFHPRSVRVDGRRLRRWDYDRRARVLSTRLPKGTTELVVRAKRPDARR